MTSHYLNQWWLDYWCIYASLGLNEFTHCGLVLPNSDRFGSILAQVCLVAQSHYLHHCWLIISRVLHYSLIGNGTGNAPWWRHQMETFSALLAICAGNSPVPGEFPTQRPVTRSFDVFFICAWINGWVNNRDAGDLRRHHAHYDIIIMHGSNHYSALKNYSFKMKLHSSQETTS